MKKIITLIVMMAICLSAFAGPFGLEFGWTLEDLDENGIFYMNQGLVDETDPTTTLYRVNPPDPSVFFDMYNFDYLDNSSNENEFSGIKQISAIAVINYSDPFAELLPDMYNYMIRNIKNNGGTLIQSTTTLEDMDFSNPKLKIAEMYSFDHYIVSNYLLVTEDSQAMQIDVALYCVDFETALLGVIIDYLPEITNMYKNMNRN